MRQTTYKQEVQEVLNSISLKRPKPKPPKVKRKWFYIPETKPLSISSGAFLFGGITLVGIAIGAAIGTYVFFGCITLAGFIAISENNKYIRYAVQRSNKMVDVSIFALTLYATLALGTTITAALTIAGLGYTLVYAPWLRKQR